MSMKEKGVQYFEKQYKNMISEEEHQFRQLSFSKKFKQQ